MSAGTKPLAGRRLLVTGAGSGIGRVAARMLAERGATLLLLGRRLEALRETVPAAEHAALDHADEGAVSAYAARCGGLDGMLLAAGQFLAGTVGETPGIGFDKMIAANLRGPWLLAHHLGPRLARGASVVLVGSNIGIRAVPATAAYAVAKAGLHMLARVLACEWAARSIRCNAIAPGPVLTPMLEARVRGGADPEGDLGRLSKVNPLGRLGREEEIAALALHLLSDESTWTTGAVIPCDGGATAVF